MTKRPRSLKVGEWYIFARETSCIIAQYLGKNTSFGLRGWIELVNAEGEYTMYVSDYKTIQVISPLVKALL
jgi:hypothetical protein